MNILVITSIPAIDPPIFQLPVITQAITKVSNDAAILQVIVFNKDLLKSSMVVKYNIFLKYFLKSEN